MLRCLNLSDADMLLFWSPVEAATPDLENYVPGHRRLASDKLRNLVVQLPVIEVMAIANPAPRPKIKAPERTTQT